MRNKIILTVAITVLMLSACGQPADEKAKELDLTKYEDNNSLSEEQYESDAERAGAFVEAMNPEGCTTVKDKNLAIYCNDEAYSRKAFTEQDLELCEPIIDELMREVCTRALEGN